MPQNTNLNNPNRVLSSNEIFERIRSHVVKIENYDERPAAASMGSGVLLDMEGYVVTNYHVIENCKSLTLISDEMEECYNIFIAGVDKRRDLAILKTNYADFNPIKWGNSDELKIGEEIYCLGSPLGFLNSFSKGIISRLRREYEIDWDIPTNLPIQNFIQFTASASHGNSGGALVDSFGKLIGIAQSKNIEGENISFAVPVNDVLELYREVKRKRKKNNSVHLYLTGGFAFANNNNLLALKNFTTLISRRYNKSEMHLERGIVNASMERRSRYAIRDFTLAIKSRTYRADAYFNRAKMYFDIGNIKNALKDIDKAIKLKPKNPHYYLERGRLYLSNKQYGKAIVDFKRTIKHEQDNYNAHYYLGISYFSMRKPNVDKATDYLLKCIHLDEINGEAYYTLSEVIADPLQKIDLIKSAARLDYKQAKEWLLQQGYTW